MVFSVSFYMRYKMLKKVPTRFFFIPQQTVIYPIRYKPFQAPLLVFRVSGHPLPLRCRQIGQNQLIGGVFDHFHTRMGTQRLDQARVSKVEHPPIGAGKSNLLSIYFRPRCTVVPQSDLTKRFRIAAVAPPKQAPPRKVPPIPPRNSGISSHICQEILLKCSRREATKITARIIPVLRAHRPTFVSFTIMTPMLHFFLTVKKQQ